MCNSRAPSSGLACTAPTGSGSRPPAGDQASEKRRAIAENSGLGLGPPTSRRGSGPPKEPGSAEDTALPVTRAHSERSKHPMPEDQPPGSSRRLQRCDVLSQLYFISRRVLGLFMPCLFKPPRDIPSFGNQALRTSNSLTAAGRCFQKPAPQQRFASTSDRPLHFSPVVVAGVRPHETKQTGARKQPAHETEQTGENKRPGHRSTTASNSKKPEHMSHRLSCVVPCVLLLRCWFPPDCFFVRLDSCPLGSGLLLSVLDKCCRAPVS